MDLMLVDLVAYTDTALRGWPVKIIVIASYQSLETCSAHMERISDVLQLAVNPVNMFCIERPR